MTDVFSRTRWDASEFGRMPTPKLCRAAKLKSEYGAPLTLNWSQEPRINNL